MKYYHKTFLLPILLISSALALTSCELVTENPPQPNLKPANHLVINEVFTLPPTHQRTFSWIEFYNPTRNQVNLSGATFSFTTSAILTTVAIDSNGQPIFQSFRQFILPDAVYEIPLPPVVLGPGEFLTATNNEERLLTYTDYGPGNGPTQNVGGVLSFRVDTVVTPDPAIPDTVMSWDALFQFRTTDQLVLKDPTGVAVDVVRYGNYVYPGPGADPYPANRSIGAMPEYQSIARWGGAYFTGNTADDFYITASPQVPLTRPIPHWLSQNYKQ